jgi:hypothetical protein
MTQEIRKGQYTTDAPAPTAPPPPIPSPPLAPHLNARSAKLYDSHPEALVLRSAFPSSNSLLVDGIQVAIVDYQDPYDSTSKREWNAFVYALSPPVNFQPFDSRRLLLWWLRSEDGIQAVREAWQAGQQP